MDIEILKLNKQQNKRQLVEFLNQTPVEEIASLVEEKLVDYGASNDVDTGLLLRAIFQGSPALEGYAERRYLVIRSVIRWLSTEDKENSEKSKQASNMVTLVLPQIEVLSRRMLKDGGIMITDNISAEEPMHPLNLDILSKIWNVLSAAEERDELEEIFDSLIKGKWNNKSVVALSSAVNEMEFSDKQLETVVKLMLKKLSDIEMEEVPPFIYQLLLISRKGHKRLILSGILDFFNKASSENASRMEGTVMLHISFAIKQDQSLGNELVKLVKGNKESQLETFNVACLLSAARIHRLQDTIFDLFRTSINSIYRDEEKADRSLWISKYSSLDAQKYCQVLLDVVEKSAYGWDQVVQSLTQLSIILIDTAASGPGSFFASLTKDTVKTRSSTTKGDGPNEHVASLGVEILFRLFKYHDVVRGEILEQITSRVVSRANSTTEFLQLLEKIIDKCPDAVEKYLSNLRDTLDFLSFLPLATAQHLLSALQPISRTNEHFRDGLMLILRKSLFAKDLDGRQMAVGGFLNILKDQFTEIKHAESDGQKAAAEVVAFEILGLLRRCFSQQAEIRTNVYNGLGSLGQEHSSFAGDIFDLLYTQFARSYEKDVSITNPIKIEVCVENASNGGYPKIQEPIHVLLANIIKVLRATQRENMSFVAIDSISRFRANMRSFVLRLSRATLEDFELDKSATFEGTTHVGLRNIYHASILIGCYEVAMDYQFSADGLTSDSSEVITTLFKKRKALLGAMITATNDKGKKACITGPICVSLDFMSRLFLSIFPKDVPKSAIDPPVRALRSDIDFVQFIVEGTSDTLKVAIDDEFCQQDNEHFKTCVRLCEIYMHILKMEDSDSIYVGQQKNFKKSTPSVLSSIANSILIIFEIVNNVWSDRFVELLTFGLDPSGENAQLLNVKSRNRITIEVTLQLKEIVLRYLSGRSPVYREVSSVLHIATYLCEKLDRKAEDFSMRTAHVIRWLDTLAKERPIEEPALAKEIISLLIKLCAATGEFDTIQRICEDIHVANGDLDNGMNADGMEADVQYQIINEKTKSTITVQASEFIDSSFDDLTWCIRRLKLCAANSEDDKTREFETELCNRLTALLLVLSELIKAVLHDVHAENLFKALTKAYKTLHTIVKYKLGYPKDISTDFINMISKSGTEITEKMYKFLTAYGQHQQEAGAAVTAKKKGKKREVDTKQKAKIQRESKMIPNLIFAVEQFEISLINLSRKSKVDFMQYMKRSTSRDFKIHLNVIQQDESSEEEEDPKAKMEGGIDEEEAEEDNAGQPAAKRVRRGGSA